MSVQLFGHLDRQIARIAFAVVGLLLYGKMLSDMAELYITGHTTNFMWFMGDLGKPTPGPYNFIGLFMMAFLGYANVHIWVRIFGYYYNKTDKYLGPYFRLAVSKLVDAWTNHLEAHKTSDSKYGRFCAWQDRTLESQGKRLMEEKVALRKQRVERLEQRVIDAKLALKEAREELNTASMPNTTVGDS